MDSEDNWDIANVVSQIHSMSRKCSCSTENSWKIKQDLFLLQEMINESLKKCPSFGSKEKEWLKKREQNRIIKILKD